MQNQMSSVRHSGSLETTEEIENLRSQGAVYQLLARFLESEVDCGLLLILRTELQEPLQEIGIELDPWLLEGAQEEILDRLAEEYTGLLVAPGGVSPYLSVFETGTMFKEASDRVALAYHEVGLEYRPQYSGEFPDHIGTMLAFVGYLYQAQADALQQGDLPEASRLVDLRRHFLVDQLGHWAPGWCQRAVQAALLSLYQQVIALVGQLLWSDLAMLVDRKQLRQLQQANCREPKKLDYDADFRKASGI
ncbi:MAG TPA: hypothetical protein ENI62_01100 [Gammaproteobacteria bacterium]|nr:hypothetical protein [Gammaproteobacteria bacterium]